MNDDMKKDGIRGATETLYDDCLHSEKALFWLATQWRRLHYWLGIPSCIVSALAGAAIIQEFSGLAAILTTIAAVLTALLTFLQPQNVFKTHHECGVKYGILRNKIDRFKTIDLDGKFDDKEARLVLEAMAAEKAELQSAAPHTGGLAYYFAKRSIKAGQHRADKERAQGAKC